MADYPEYGIFNSRFGFPSSNSYDVEEARKNKVTNADDALKKLQDLLFSNQNNDIPHLEDKFLMRFLYARKMNINESYTLLCNYFSYRIRNKELFENLTVDDPLIKQALYDGFPGVLPEKDRKGRCVLVFFGNNWEQANYPLEVVYKSLLITLEELITDVNNQINGFVIIVDWTDISFRQVTSISPRVLGLMVEGLQDCFPAKFKGIHFLNQPWYIERLLSILKTFLKEKTSKKIFVHGNNLVSLHSHVTPAILPSELGGEGPPFSPTSWAHSLTTQRHEPK
ncbi:clavesin-2 [Halyomorpha halys]|uniref:clavesin-2 n=1 Tax=Halyomorpha halys TaxID=286706 RepID=UPI0006D50413|nr:clavesin-2 [Halyomorpha halys]